MANALKIEGVNRVIRSLRRLAANSRRLDGGNVIVGYTAEYALRVHEMRMVNPGKKRRPQYPGHKPKGKYWDPQGRAQPKFLEEPLREMESRGEIRNIVADAYKKTRSLIKGLKLAGLRVQRESQKRVPVDTGDLKASAFTREER